MFDHYRMNPHVPFKDTGICSICGKPRKAGGHVRCSKKRKAMFSKTSGKTAA